MKFELRQHFQIESARFLPNLADGHPCKRMHGHSFKVTLVLTGESDPVIGWVQDYHEIDQKIRPLLNQLDHRVLNEVRGLENPTSENLSYWIYTHAKIALPSLVQVRISETASTECAYPVL